jgi:hypothetical protein
MTRQRPPGYVWLLPIRFSDCQLPLFDLGAGRTLDSLQQLDLFDGSTWDSAVARLVAVLHDVRNPLAYVPVVSPGSTELIESPQDHIEFPQDHIADPPLCLICRTEMRDTGSHYVCEDCGSTTGARQARIVRVANAPLCLTCGTKMRGAGSCYVCEGCGSTRSMTGKFGQFTHGRRRSGSA